MKKIPLILLAFTTFIACKKETNLETIDELTVQAILHAGQTIDTVKFGKVIPLDSLKAFPAPESLEPMVIVEGGTSFPLYYTGENGVYHNPDITLEEGKAYRLEVVYNNKQVTADTYIPEKPYNISLSDTLIQRDKIIDFTDLQNQEIPDPIELYWDGEDGAYYFVNVQNIENDPELINELFAGGARPPRPDILTEPSINNFYTIDAFRDITHYGTYEVTVFRVNPEYVALYEDNTSGTGSLNEVRTNVQNGFGIFTGVNSTTVFFEVIK